MTEAHNEADQISTVQLDISVPGRGIAKGTWFFTRTQMLLIAPLLEQLLGAPNISEIIEEEET